MLNHEYYVREKLRDLEAEHLVRLAITAGDRKPAPVIGPIVRSAGRVLRRVGEGLESWATPADAERLELERSPR